MNRVFILFFIHIVSLGFSDSFSEKISQMIAQRESAISEDRKLQIQCALTAFGTIKAKEVVYVSSPITSGRRLYEYMDRNGYKTWEEARKDRGAFWQDVMLPNIEEGERVSCALEKQVDGVVIAPTSFENKKVGSWGQNEYMSMWLSFIEQKVTCMWMLDGWQYSNGSSEEYLWAVLMQRGFASRDNIEIVDARGEVLTLDRGIALLSDALLDMQMRGLKSNVTEEVLSTLLEIKKDVYE